MRNKFWLIQRGKFRDNFDTAKGFLGGSPDRLIDPDYMGSAEFEWGAIPRAYIRLLDTLDKQSLNPIDAIKPTELRNIAGKTLWLMCDPIRYDAVINAIKGFIKDPYPLKEYSHLDVHFSETLSHYRKYALESTNFWWCIDHPYQYREDSIGDWIAFIGGNDNRANALARVLLEDLQNFWQAKPQEEREQKLLEAYR